MAAYLPLISLLINLALAAFVLFRRESREDGQTTSQRLRKIEAEQANADKRMTGFQGEIEDVADKARRDLATAADVHKRDYEALKEQIKEVPNMRDMLYRMVERLENTGKAVEKLDGKMDRIVELLTHK